MDASEYVTCVVQTNDGPVRGYMDKKDVGTSYKFKSIPYAKPPIGNLRFLPPSPITPWTEEIECIQGAPFPLCLNHTTNTSEDCLYIELSTPNLKPNKPLPVMFWIGGLNYCHYYDHLCDPTDFNTHDIMYVRCGFRLGPFGFLSTGDIAAPGNCGLKDIIMALKWVKTNIGAFGGDPSNVTLFGSGSGGSIVHFMVLSPMAAGLFHKAIIQSSCALNNWAVSLNPYKSVSDLANQLGIKSSQTCEIIEELRSLPASEIMEAFHQLLQDLTLHNSDIVDPIFKPCVETEFEGQQAFLTKSPVAIIKSGSYNKVPLIAGSNNIEGAIRHIKNEYHTNMKKIWENVTRLIPTPLCKETKSMRTINSQVLLKFYLGQTENLNEDNRIQYAQMVSDFYFLYYMNMTVRLHSEYGPDCPIFYYIFNCNDEYSLIEDSNYMMGYCAEFSVMYRIKSQITNVDRNAIVTRNRFMTMWTNFAKYGTPTPDDNDPLLQITWDPIENKDRLNYLHIGYELTKGRNPFYDRMKCWDELHGGNAILKAIVYYNEMGIAW